MIRRSYFTAAGSLALAAGIGLQHFTHGNLVHFVGGFLVGISIALLILGLGRPSRNVSR